MYAATSPCNSHRKLATSTDGLQTTLELAAQQLQSTASKKRVDYVQDDQSLRSACLFKQTFFCSIHILSFVCAPALFSSLLSTKPTLVSPHKGAAYCSLFSSLSPVPLPHPVLYRRGMGETRSNQRSSLHFSTSEQKHRQAY